MDVNFNALIPEVPVRRQPTKFTPERIAQIQNLLERGHSREQIADIVGCTLNTLAVTCSKLGISLRRPRLDNGMGIIKRPFSLSAAASDPDSEESEDIVKLPCKSKLAAAPCKPVDLTDPTDPIPPIAPPPAPSKHEPATPIFTLRMSYQGRERITPLPLSADDLATLAVEAEIRGMRIGELIAKLIFAIVQRGMFDQVGP